MDFDQTLRILYAEKKKIERVIASLERLQGITIATPGGPGRTWMGEEERREVSARMKRYWAERRKHARCRALNRRGNRPSGAPIAPVPGINAAGRLQKIYVAGDPPERIG